MLNRTSGDLGFSYGKLIPDKGPSLKEQRTEAMDHLGI